MLAPTNVFCRYWNQEIERAKDGYKARLWFALFRCIQWIFIVHGILFGIEVCSTKDIVDMIVTLCNKTIVKPMESKGYINLLMKLQLCAVTTKCEEVVLVTRYDFVKLA